MTSSQGLRGTWSSCNFPVIYIQGFRVQAHNYKTSLCYLSLHCGTWDMYPVAVPLNAHASIVQVYIHVHVVGGLSIGTCACKRTCSANACQCITSNLFTPVGDLVSMWAT